MFLIRPSAVLFATAVFACYPAADGGIIRAAFSSPVQSGGQIVDLTPVAAELLAVVRSSYNENRPEALYARFSPQMRQALSFADLSSLYRDGRRENGMIQRVDAVTAVHEQGFPGITAKLAFTQGAPAEMVLLVAPDGQIAFLQVEAE